MAEGIQKGMEKGIEKGIAEGMEKGMEKGMAEGVAKVARNLKQKGFSVAEITDATGLTEEQIRGL